MSETIIEPRRQIPTMRELFNKYPVGGGVRYPASFASVKYNNIWKTIRNISETPEHKEAEGQIILVSQVNNSKVLLMELSPKIGRMWHISHLELKPNSMYRHNQTAIRLPKGLYPPAAYISQDMVYLCGSYIDPLVDSSNMYRLLFEHDNMMRIPTSSIGLGRLRTPSELASVINAEIDDPLIEWYKNQFPKITESSIIKDTDCLFQFGIFTDVLSTSAYGRSLNTTFRPTYRSRTNIAIDTQDNPDLSIVGTIIQNILTLYPIDNPALASEIVLPMAAIDFSVNEFSYRGADSFVKIKVPDSLPENYHYPYLWNVMAGEEVVTPCFMVDNDPLNTRIYTPMGNSVPAEYFEIIETNIS